MGGWLQDDSLSPALFVLAYSVRSYTCGHGLPLRNAWQAGAVIRHGKVSARMMRQQ